MTAGGTTPEDLRLALLEPALIKMPLAATAASRKHLRRFSARAHAPLGAHYDRKTYCYRLSGRWKSVCVRCGGAQSSLRPGDPATIQDRRIEWNVRRRHHRGPRLGVVLKGARGDRTPVESSIIACWKIFGPDAAGARPRLVRHPDGAAGRARSAPVIASSPSSMRFMSRWRGRSSRGRSSPICGRFWSSTSTSTLCRRWSSRKPGAPGRGGRRARGRLQDLQLGARRDQLEALLASAAIPNLFPAVWVDGHAYWDGIFSSNPPVIGFLQKAFMGKHAVPEEIWIIQVNRVEARHRARAAERHLRSPQSPGRQPEPAARAELIEMVNMLLQEGALTDEFRARFGVDAPNPSRCASSACRRSCREPRLPEQALAAAGPHRQAHRRRRGASDGLSCQSGRGGPSAGTHGRSGASRLALKADASESRTTPTSQQAGNEATCGSVCGCRSSSTVPRTAMCAAALFVIMLLSAGARAQKTPATGSPVPSDANAGTWLPPHYDEGFVLVSTSDAARMPFRLRINHVSQFKYTNTLAVDKTYTDHLGEWCTRSFGATTSSSRETSFTSPASFSILGWISTFSSTRRAPRSRRRRPGTWGMCSTRLSRSGQGSSRCRACAA